MLFYNKKKIKTLLSHDSILYSKQNIINQHFNLIQLIILSHDYISLKTKLKMSILFIYKMIRDEIRMMINLFQQQQKKQS